MDIRGHSWTFMLKKLFVKIRSNSCLKKRHPQRIRLDWSWLG